MTQPTNASGEHIVDGEFQSDKYPDTPRGLIPFKATDPMAQDLLWQYAQRRRAVDPQFAADLEWILREKGYVPPLTTDTDREQAQPSEYDLEIARQWMVSHGHEFEDDPAEFEADQKDLGELLAGEHAAGRDGFDAAWEQVRTLGTAVTRLRAALEAKSLTESQFHTVWTAAVGKPGYSKPLFQDVLAELKAEGKITDFAQQPEPAPEDVSHADDD